MKRSRRGSHLLEISSIPLWCCHGLGFYSSVISRFVFNFSSCVNVCLVSHLVSVYTCVSLLNHSLCVLACDVPSLFVGFVCFPTSIPLSSCVCLLNLPFCRLLLGFLVTSLWHSAYCSFTSLFRCVSCVSLCQFLLNLTDIGCIIYKTWVQRWCAAQWECNTHQLDWSVPLPTLAADWLFFLW